MLGVPVASDGTAELFVLGMSDWDRAHVSNTETPAFEPKISLYTFLQLQS